MELRSYWAILRRRFWIIALVVGVIALYAGYQYYQLYKTPGALKAYQSAVTIRVDLTSSAATSKGTASDSLAASEALADTFTNGSILTSPEFSTQVVEQIQADTEMIKQKFGSDVDLSSMQNPGAVSSSITAQRIRSLITFTVNWPTQAGSWAIANAVGEVSHEHIGSYLNLASATVVNVPTNPVPAPGQSSNKPALLLVLLLVGFIIAISLAFLMEYLDDRIRTPDEVVQVLQIPVFGEVPRAPSLGKRS